MTTYSPTLRKLLWPIAFIVTVVGCSAQPESTAATSTPLQAATDACPEEATVFPVAKVSMPVEWKTPFNEEESFFSPPTVAEQTNQVIEATPEHQAVRLLGFANRGGKNGTERLAILKIGHRMLFMTEGETQQGVELLKIDGRTVHLHRGRDRWSLTLMKQPVVNPGVQPPSRRNRASQSSKLARPVSDPLLQDMPVPELPLPAMEEFAEPSAIDLESGFDALPTMPDLLDEPEILTP